MWSVRREVANGCRQFHLCLKDSLCDCCGGRNPQGSRTPPTTIAALTKSKSHSTSAPFSCFLCYERDLSIPSATGPSSRSPAPSQGSDQVQIGHHPLQNDSPMRLSFLWSMLQWGMKYLSSSDLEIISSGNYIGRILNALTQMIVWTGNTTYFMCIDFQIDKWASGVFVRSLRAWCRGQRLIDIFCFPIHTLRKL